MPTPKLIQDSRHLTASANGDKPVALIPRERKDASGHLL